MTEQEKSREDIYKKYRREMSEDLMESMPIELKDRAFGDEIWLANKIVRMCHSMIDKGYRKEEEVRKKTAEIIIDKLMECVQSFDCYDGYMYYAVETKDILEIADEFCVPREKFLD